MTTEGPSDTQRDLLRIIDAIDEGSATELKIQKFAFQLVRNHDTDSLKPFSIYMGGVYSIEIKKTLCEMEGDLVDTKPSPREEVSADTYYLTDKGEKVLDNLGRSPLFSEVYEQFRTRYGLTSNWWIHTDTIRSWISNETHCVATDNSLHDALRRRAQHSGRVDDLIMKCARKPRPTAVLNHNDDAADIIHLALQLIKDNKWIPEQRDEKQKAYEQYVDNRTRFSIRNILNESNHGEDNLEGTIVCLKGFAECIEQSGMIFDLKEDTLSTSPSITIEFFGEWDEPAEKILSQYSIGVIGHVHETEEDPVIKALAIIKSNQLPQHLRSSDKGSLEKIREEQRSRIGDLVKHREEFTEGYEGELTTETADNERTIQRIQELIVDHIPEEQLPAPVRQCLKKLIEEFRDSSDDLMRFAFWIEVMRKIAGIIT